jgi:hypothetical protein
MVAIVAASAVQLRLVGPKSDDNVKRAGLLHYYLPLYGLIAHLATFCTHRPLQQYTCTLPQAVSVLN